MVYNVSSARKVCASAGMNGKICTTILRIRSGHRSGYRTDALIPPDKLTGHDRPDRILVVFNTLIDNKNSLMMAGRNRAGRWAITFANISS